MKIILKWTEDVLVPTLKEKIIPWTEYLVNVMFNP